MFILLSTAASLLFGVIGFLFFRASWRILGSLSVVFSVFFALADLILLQVSPLIIAIIVASIGAILFGLISIRRFRSRRTTAGAVFAVLALFFVLVDVKAFQFRKMGSSPMQMPAET